eukprot:TRINITY_DN2927_c0_g1_i2.p1 TRINITY_DN2927_c0_g1~~TRINITY_DN2927_c0_g1_i2.p1  ORF type:complete len:446 (-),score=46.26 TRINITY_DN2927_c0_g1_i2:30-1313(-)
MHEVFYHFVGSVPFQLPISPSFPFHFSPVVALSSVSFPSLLTIVVLFVLYFCFFFVDKPEVFCQRNANNQQILKGLENVLKPMWPSFVALNKHFHTIYASKLRKGPQVTFKREELKSPDDGGTFAIDWFIDGKSEDPTRPIIFIIPGIANSSKSVYLRIFLNYLKGVADFRACVYVPRGCGRLPITSHKPRLFTPGGTRDVHHAVNLVFQRYPNTPVLAVGYSLGGNCLAKYLGEYSENRFIGALVFAQGFDGWKGIQLLREKPFYNFGLTRKLQRILRKHQEAFKDYVNVDHMLKAKRVEDFDHQLVTSLYGYSSLEDYYSSESCIEYVNNICIPICFINARDDPLVPPELIPLERLISKPNIIHIQTKYGGHLGWSETEWRLMGFPHLINWADKFVIQYFHTLLNSKNHTTKKVIETGKDLRMPL